MEYLLRINNSLLYMILNLKNSILLCWTNESGSTSGSPNPTTTLTRNQLKIDPFWPVINMDKEKTLKKKSVVTERGLFHTSHASIIRPSTPLTSHSSPEPQDAFNILKGITDSLTFRQVMKKTKFSLLWTTLCNSLLQANVTKYTLFKVTPVSPKWERSPQHTN